MQNAEQYVQNKKPQLQIPKWKHVTTEISNTKQQQSHLRILKQTDKSQTSSWCCQKKKDMLQMTWSSTNSSSYALIGWLRVVFIPNPQSCEAVTHLEDQVVQTGLSPPTAARTWHLEFNTGATWVKLDGLSEAWSFCLQTTEGSYRAVKTRPYIVKSCRTTLLTFRSRQALVCTYFCMKESPSIGRFFGSSSWEIKNFHCTFLLLWVFETCFNTCFFHSVALGGNHRRFRDRTEGGRSGLEVKQKLQFYP